MSARCPSFEALSKAFSAPISLRIMSHLSECERCRKTWSDFSRLKEAGNALPFRALDSAEVKVRQAELLERALKIQVPLGRWRRVAIPTNVVLATAAALAVAWLVERAPDTAPAERAPVETENAGVAPIAAPIAASVPFEASPPSAGHRGKIVASPSARYQHRWQESVGFEREEIVQLSEGRLEIQVAELGPGERFRFLSGDASVEIRAAELAVEVVKGRLRSIQMISGMAELHRANGTRVQLASGDHWTAPNLPKPRAALDAAPSLAAAESPAETPAEAAFVRGWDALSQGDLSGAVLAFEQSELLSEGSALAEDASYWHAASLARAGRAAESEALFFIFLKRFPRSARSGEVCVLLGQTALLKGENVRARQLFSRALQDPQESVKKSAERGLEAASN